MESDPEFPGWWRGSMEARLEDAEESVKELWRFKSDAEKRIVAMETKMVVFAAIAAAGGAFAADAIAAIFK
jgi:hypothetical protein